MFNHNLSFSNLDEAVIEYFFLKKIPTNGHPSIDRHY